MPGIGQTDTSWSRWIDGYSRWQSSTRASFLVVHLSLIKSIKWSPSLPFALSSQRQKVVKLFSSRSEHSSRRAASLGWSEGLQHPSPSRHPSPPSLVDCYFWCKNPFQRCKNFNCWVICSTYRTQLVHLGRKWMSYRFEFNFTFFTKFRDFLHGRCKKSLHVGIPT